MGAANTFNKNKENIDVLVAETLRKFIGPTVLSILATCVVGFVNTLVAGRMLGTVELATMNIGSSVNFIYAMIGCLVGIGGASATSVAIGKHDEKRAGAITTVSLILAIVISLIVTGVLLIVYDAYLQFTCEGTGELYQVSKPYIRLMILGGGLTTFMYYPFNFLKVQGRTNSTLIMFGVLIVADFAALFTLLNLGVGVEGMAYTVIISTAICDLTGVLLMVRRGGETTFGKVYRFWSCTGEIFRLGVAAAVNNLCNFLRTIVLNYIFLKYMGKDGVSILAAASAVLNFAMASVAGVGQAVAPILGVFYAEGDYSSIKNIMKIALKDSVVIQIIVTVVGAIASVPLAYAFGLGADAFRTVAAISFVLVLASLIVGGFNSTMIFYYTIAKKTGLALFLTVLRAFAILDLFCYLLLRVSPGSQVFFSYIAAELATLGINMLVYLVAKRKNNKIKTIYLLEEDDDEGVFRVDISTNANPEGIIDSINKVRAEIEDKGLDMKTEMMIPLALEEMLAVIGNNAYDSSSSKQPVDVRILIREENAVVRLRYLGKLFDPLEYYRIKTESLSEEELLMDDSLGIKLIVNAAKEVDYSRTLGMNNLVVRV